MNDEEYNRHRISVWAYGREFYGHNINTDALYLHLCKGIDLNIRTTRPDLDAFFICEFRVGATKWVRRHPELDKIAADYNTWHLGGKHYD